MCYVSSTFAAWDPKTASIKGIPSGRAPGVFGGDPIECEGLLAVDPNDRNHFIYAPTGQQQGGAYALRGRWPDDREVYQPQQRDLHGHDHL